MSNELIIKIEANQSNGMEVYRLNLDGSNITIDWGDSTIDDYSEYIEHEYSEEGEYTITITGVSGIQDDLLYGISNVVEVIIPNNITSLPSEVFYECSNLEKVVLPNGISSIGSRFCNDCPNLVELNLPDGLENIGTLFLYGCGLDEVIFPYGLSAIKTGALQSSNVSNVVIPKSVTSIGDNVFPSCQNLSYIEIPNSVESIGNRFGYDSPLTTIKFFSETPPTIGSDFLTGNDNCSIHIPEGSLENYLNQQGFPTESSRYVEYPTLKYKLETLGKLMASNLTKQFVSASWDEGLITLANKVRNIQDFNDIFEFDSSNDYASKGFRMTWSALTETNVSYFTLKIPSTITTLSGASFHCFSSMRICEIPSSVTSIGNDVFSGTNKLEKIIFKGTTPPTATSSSFWTNSGQASFDIPTTCVIEVPCNALSAYKSATNYPDPTVYTYQCIWFDEKCDSSPVNSNISSPILVYGSAIDGVQSIVYNSQENAYELSGSGDDMVIFPINGLSGITDIEFSCEVKIPYPWNGVWVGLGATPPESGTGQTINDTYADVVFVRALDSNGKTSCVYMPTQKSTTGGTNSITANRSNTGWIRIILNFTSSNTLTARVEELDGTELATFSKTVSSQVSDRHYGIYYRDNGDTSVKTYIRNIKCIGY